ncbi:MULTISPECIES: hypothetical protein [Chryseobacterium]|uniref:hypothetical protein n=1 Tax=Chryseobacterium TaxID=59732 RepID=UPI001297D67F|nr:MULTISPECIES: hypothetical protein [Chryseobacterium]MDR6920591.1 hypothetical protein [Chryseobacterium sp. 2987]
MAAIKNMEGLTHEQINHELQRGARFVHFQYTISIIIMTFKRGSDIYFIKSDDVSVKYSWKYSLLTFVFGWWGFPFGPIYSISSLYSNFKGGKDITQEVLNHFSTAQTVKEVVI